MRLVRTSPQGMTHYPAWRAGVGILTGPGHVLINCGRTPCAHMQSPAMGVAVPIESRGHKTVCQSRGLSMMCNGVPPGAYGQFKSATAPQRWGRALHEVPLSQGTVRARGPPPPPSGMGSSNERRREGVMPSQGTPPEPRG